MQATMQHNTHSNAKTTIKATWRDATPAEVAAYKEAVRPLIGNAKAVIDLRYRMHLLVTSKGIKVKVRH